MKKIIVVLLAAFFAISCSMSVSDKTGSLTLSGARGVLNDSNGNPAIVRYSLTRNGRTILLNNQSLFDVSGSDTATIDSLIPGDGYKLGVSVGYKTGVNFVVDSYGYSETFAIAEGTNSPVNVALQNAPTFAWLTSTGGKSSAAVVEPTVWIQDGNAIGHFDSSTSDWTIEDLLTSMHEIVLSVNSLSTGKQSSGSSILWLNTTTGLYKYDDAMSTRLNAELSTNVLFSRAVSVSSNGIGVYSGGGSNIGFTFSNPNDFVTPWQTAADYPAISEFLPEIKQDVIRSIAVNDLGFFYVATPLGTAIGSITTGTIEVLLNTSGTNWLKISGSTASINVVSTAKDRVYAGTNFGLYTSIVDSVGIPDGSGFNLVPGTAGKKFVALESSAVGLTDVITAAVTDDNWVYLIKGDALIPSVPSIVNPLPAASGIPINAKPVFYEGFSTLHLILSGTNGSIDFDTTQNFQ